MAAIAYLLDKLGNCPLGIDNEYPWDKMRAMELKTWLKSELGRANALAKAIDVPPSFVSKMASGEKPVPVVHMAEIERFTGGEVSRIELYGDGWQKIWPELAISEEKQPLPSAARSSAATEAIATHHPAPPQPAPVEAAASQGVL